MNLSNYDKWDFNYKEGKIINGYFQTIWNDCNFKYKDPIKFGNIWEIEVKKGSKSWIGFVDENFDINSNDNLYAFSNLKNVMWVRLCDGTGVVGKNTNISNITHYSYSNLKNLIPTSESYLVSVRINKELNIPQINFSKDKNYQNNTWYDFIDNNYTKKSFKLKNKSFYPFIKVWDGDELSNFNLISLKLTKSANNKLI